MCENDLLNEIKKYQFYAVELNLYLDNFPSNKKARNDYKIISKRLDDLIMDYEKNFGPLRNFGSAYFVVNMIKNAREGIIMCENDLLNEIKKYQFYAVELNLYLDNFPSNKKARNDYKIISKRLDDLIMDYEKNFGPLRNFGSAYFENPVAWVSSPWPWENY